MMLLKTILKKQTSASFASGSSYQLGLLKQSFQRNLVMRPFSTTNEGESKPEAPKQVEAKPTNEAHPQKPSPQGAQQYQQRNPKREKGPRTNQDIKQAAQ